MAALDEVEVCNKLKSSYHLLLSSTQHLMDPTGNFSAYRSCLMAAMSSMAQDKQQVNCSAITILPMIKLCHFIADELCYTCIQPNDKGYLLP